jgi:hypothetical protein
MEKAEESHAKEEINPRIQADLWKMTPAYALFSGGTFQSE